MKVKKELLNAFNNWVTDTSVVHEVFLNNKGYTKVLTGLTKEEDIKKLTTLMQKWLDEVETCKTVHLGFLVILSHFESFCYYHNISVEKSHLHGPYGNGMLRKAVNYNDIKDLIA